MAVLLRLSLPVSSPSSALESGNRHRSELPHILTHMAHTDRTHHTQRAHTHKEKLVHGPAVCAAQVPTVLFFLRAGGEGVRGVCGRWGEVALG